MKKNQQKIINIVADKALKNAEKQIDTACILWGYQPHFPNKLRRQSAEKH